MPRSAPSAPKLLSMLIASTLLASTGAIAQSDLPSLQLQSSQVQMPALRVLGGGDQSVTRQTGAAVFVNREAIERVQPTSTEDVLRRIPGINATTEEESAVVSNIGIRGLSANQQKSLILEDGVPVAPGLFVGNGRYFNPRIQRMEGVEVLKGSSSLRYGPSTIGGVVNYLTKTPDDGVKFSSRMGSFRTREATLEAGGRTESGDAFGGIVATRALSDGFLDRGYAMNDFMAKAGAKLSSTQTLGLKFSYYENEANISYRGQFPEEYRRRKHNNPAPDDYFLTDRKAFDLTHEWLLSDAVTLTTLLYWSQVTRDYYRYNVNVSASNAAGRWVYLDTLRGNNRSFERHGAETRLAVDYDWFGMASEAEFGLRVLRESVDDQVINATRMQDRSGPLTTDREDSAKSFAAYVHNRFALTDRLAVTPGLRVESYSQKRVDRLANNRSANTRNTEWLPGVGFTYDLAAQAQLYGGVYRAFAPAQNAEALSGSTDQNLDAEKSVNTELGIRGSVGETTYEFTGFYMDFTNQVVAGNSNPELAFSSAGKTEHYGLEGAVGFPLGAGFSVDANATWVPKSAFRTGENRGNRLPYAPRVLANLALHYTQGGFGSSLTAHHRGAQFGDATNRSDFGRVGDGIWGGKIPAYTVYDLFMQYRINESVRVRGAVKNLTDKRYITGLRQGIYAGPERNYEIGLDLDF